MAKKDNKRLQKSFLEICNKLSLIGEITLNQKNFKNDFKVDESFTNLINKKKIKKFSVTKPILAISNNKRLKNTHLIKM